MSTWKDDAEKEQWVREQQAAQAAAIVRCEHCGIECEFTYSGVIGPWSKDDGKHLTELSDEKTWYGTRHMGRDHDLERCFKRVKAARDEALREKAATEHKWQVLKQHITMIAEGGARNEERQEVFVELRAIMLRIAESRNPCE